MLSADDTVFLTLLRNRKSNVIRDLIFGCKKTLPPVGRTLALVECRNFGFYTMAILMSVLQMDRSDSHVLSSGIPAYPV